MRDRPRQGQEAARQARDREEARLGTRESAPDALADLIQGIGVWPGLTGLRGGMLIGRAALVGAVQVSPCKLDRISRTA
ncbi:hypothetical protein BN2475_120102 [Paraburkholderia ribeironis]|uniref:Uncharacterized protein n=1 Tax=Paraburkholderia ribeironis TaxID=1247936 RepID=A0A1N7RR16_9BURK|nr:hypothetical protein BN2475_120102 [Paraburkholderia ribeironis]